MRNKLHIHRDHLVHVVPDLSMSGIIPFMVELGNALAREYQHTLLYETSPTSVDVNVLMQLQGAGIEVLQADRITTDILDAGSYTGAVLYNVEHPDLGTVLPSLYYSYGALDSNTKADVYVGCSKYAGTQRSYGPSDNTTIDADFIVPPVISSRTLRRVKSLQRPSGFTLAILTSGYMDKYPCSTVIRLLDLIPIEIGIILTTLPKYKHPGMALAIEDLRRRATGNFWTVPVLSGAAIHYMAKSDAILYATADNHNEPAGRLVLEAMGLGKGVISENRGVFPEILKHGVDAMMYDTVDEAVDHVNRLKQSPDVLKNLGANAQMHASWYDVSAHLLRFKRILRMIGS